MNKYEAWVNEISPKHSNLTDSVVSILVNLLKTNNISYLTVTGRTKTKDSILEKIERKNYKDPAKQLTDFSGIRIVAYFESDISNILDLISTAFNIDEQNSLNQDEKLSVDQNGYRSVHYVCDIGPLRANLPEFINLANLKFEIQVRTVLQHAWAELAHGRNYKFSGKLPPEIERSLFLYAGMLEIADKGFSDISEKIEVYIKKTHDDTVEGNLQFILDSLTLPQFVDNWFKENGLELEAIANKLDIKELIKELNSVGIHKASDLNDAISDKYAQVCKDYGYSSNIWGHVRNWILIFDWRTLLQENDIKWYLSPKDRFLSSFFDSDEYSEFYSSFNWEDFEDHYDWEDEV